MMSAREFVRGCGVALLLIVIGCESSKESATTQELAASPESEATESTSEALQTDAEPPAKREIPSLPEGAAEDGGLSIAQVMNVAHENKFFRELYREPANPEAVEFLAGLYAQLAKRDPPTGSDEDWQQRVDALVEAVASIRDSREGALDQFKRAVNCNSCHNRHRD